MKANYLSVIFLTDNPLLSDGSFDYNKLDAVEKTAYDTFLAGIELAKGRVGVPIFVKTMSKYANLDSVEFEKWGIIRFPSIRIYAEYPSGKQAWYNIKKGAFDSELDITKEEVANRIAFLYRGEFGEQSLLCKIFPPACQIGKWVWLGVAVSCAYKGTQARRGQIFWYVGAAVAGQEFVKRGGIESLLKVNPQPD